ncbi:MAG: HEAT repeat domain-containing protein [Pirellulaceae bacterium]
MTVRVMVVAMVVCGLTGPLTADLFYLDNGGRIEGVLLNPDESPRKSYHVKMRFGGRVTLAGDQVERVVVTSEARRAYQAFLPKVPDTVAGHWDVAERCRIAGLVEERTHHLEQILRHDPNHEDARHALGYSLVDGKWAKQDEWLVSKGYVPYRGSFRLAQEIELEKHADEQEQKVVAWHKKVKLWESWILKGRGRAVEAQANLRGIRDGWAAHALAGSLTKDKKLPPLLRQLYVDVLGKIGPSAATTVFVKLALEDSDAAIRDRCLDHLSKWRSPFAVKAFTRGLEHGQNRIVHRAAAALARMQDPSATLSLINALLTEHKQVVGGGSGINPSFSSQGGGGLSAGGGAKVIKRMVKNEPVLTALTRIHNGVNFGFDQAAWKRWYIKKSTPREVRLRRGK